MFWIKWRILAIGSPKWAQRCDEAFNEIVRVGDVPWIHMLRGNAQGGKRWYSQVRTVHTLPEVIKILKEIQKLWLEK